jgi:hypothetical protein
MSAAAAQAMAPNKTSITGNRLGRRTPGGKPPAMLSVLRITMARAAVSQSRRKRLRFKAVPSILRLGATALIHH